MKRLIEFKHDDDSYILEENGLTIFTIKAADLKFNAVDFYRGVYKNKTAVIELVNNISLDPLRKGNYIFDWLSDIINQINNAFPDDELPDIPTEISFPQKTIHLYEFAACAGDGFFIDSGIPYTDIPDPTGKADFAVKVSGDSMEPTIADQSTIYIKIVEELQHKDVGLFVVNGDVMCKRYLKQGRGSKLVPDNQNGKHKSFGKKDIISYKLIGKVLI